MLHRFGDRSQLQGTIQPLNTGFVCCREGPARSRKNVRPLGECRCGRELLLLEWVLSKLKVCAFRSMRVSVLAHCQQVNSNSHRDFACDSCLMCSPLVVLFVIAPSLPTTSLPISLDYSHLRNIRNVAKFLRFGPSNVNRL